ncbi:hypothetical protein [Mucilaginibacter agri]|uniref:Uncharacterized protein n=1 Tax=Mucilaginibacter agri TaxID=2695265 RepID=A0A965ZFP2_9SPHI|nr:hypothetical protein [Mucilaginibacter agri]NCD70050.1 hypothetical protein [Mucilaginibacter agri]
MHHIIKRFFTTAFISSWVLFVKAQSASDSLSNTTIKDKLIQQYHAGIGQQSNLYNGPVYEPNNIIVKGSALFSSPDWITGSVIYDGVPYPGTRLKYDMYKDQLISLLYNNFSSYNLMTPRVSAFDIDGHHFITVPDKPDMDGFFDELYKGKSQVLVKRKMVVQNSSSLDKLEKEYEYHTYYYVGINNQYYKVSSPSDIDGLLKTHKKEVQKYVRANRSNFKKNKELAIVSAVSYYDQISNN